MLSVVGEGVRRSGDGGRGDRGVAGGEMSMCSGDNGPSRRLFRGGGGDCKIVVAFAVEEFGVGYGSSTAGDLMLFASLLLGEDCPSSVSSSARIGLSSIISVSRLLFLLELIVDVDVELVNRAILSRVISLGVLVSNRKSLSRKKFKIVCKWTCARASISLYIQQTLKKSGKGGGGTFYDT